MIYYNNKSNEAIEKSIIYKTIKREVEQRDKEFRDTRQSIGGIRYLSVVAEILKYEDIFSQIGEECFDEYPCEDQILDWFQTLMCSVGVLQRMKKEWKEMYNKDQHSNFLQSQLDLKRKEYQDLQVQLDQYRNAPAPDFLEGVDYAGAEGITMTQYHIV